MPDFGPNLNAKKRRYDDAVNAERERRWEIGTDVQLTGYTTGDGWVSLQGRPEDRSFLAQLSQTADTARMLGAPESTTYRFTDRENFNHFLTGVQVNELFVKGGLFVSQIHTDSVILKAQPNMAVDVTDDALWFPKTMRPT